MIVMTTNQGEIRIELANADLADTDLAHWPGLGPGSHVVLKADGAKDGFPQEDINGKNSRRWNTGM